MNAAADVSFYMVDSDAAAFNLCEAMQISVDAGRDRIDERGEFSNCPMSVVVRAIWSRDGR